MTSVKVKASLCMAMFALILSTLLLKNVMTRLGRSAHRQRL